MLVRAWQKDPGETIAHVHSAITRLHEQVAVSEQAYVAEQGGLLLRDWSKALRRAVA
jgi:hypothetical protein